MVVQVSQWESPLRVRFGVVHRLDSSPSVVMMLPVSNPEWIPSRDSLLAPLTDLFDFLFMLHHQEGASHILLICLIVQVSQWESPLQVRFDFGSSSRFVAGRGWEPRVDPISGFSIGISDGSSRLPLHVTSSGGSLAHPAYMFDCAGEPGGKPQQAVGVDVASVCLLLRSLALR